MRGTGQRKRQTSFSRTLPTFPSSLIPRLGPSLPPLLNLLPIYSPALVLLLPSLHQSVLFLPVLPLTLFSSLLLLLRHQDSFPSNYSSIVDPWVFLLCANAHSHQVPDAEVAIPWGSKSGGILGGGWGGVRVC